MKRTRRLLSCLIILHAASSADASWPVQYGTLASETGYSLATDSAGNVFAGGYSAYGLLGIPVLGDLDGYVAKWNSGGGLEWARALGTSSFDVAMGIGRVGTSYIAAVGETEGSLPGFTNLGSRDGMIHLFDGAGNTIWTRQFGTSGWDTTRAVVDDGRGHLYVTGYTRDAFDGFLNAGSDDAFVAQVNAATGAVNWTFQIGSAGSDRAYGVGTDSSGNVYLGGGAGAALPGQTASGLASAFVLKLDASGTLQWISQFGAGLTTSGLALTVDSADSILIAGSTGGVFPGETMFGQGDAYVRKYTADGDIVWTRQFGTDSLDFAQSVATDASGRVIVGGTTGGVFPGETTPNAGRDAFVRVFQADGTTLFTDQFGATSAYSSNADVTGDGGLAVDDAGWIYLGGNTAGALPGQTAQSAQDVFIIQVAVPEPGTAALLTIGALGFAAARRRR